jgi:transposase
MTNTPTETTAVAQGQDLNRRLREAARNVARSMVRFKELIELAKDNHIHVQQGFKSWPAYVADVISTEMGKLHADDRREIVELLVGGGMSNRAIAEAVGTSECTVRRDKEQLRQNDAVEPPSGVGATIAALNRLKQERREQQRVTGLDGKDRPVITPEQLERQRERDRELLREHERKLRATLQVRTLADEQRHLEGVAGVLEGRFRRKFDETLTPAIAHRAAKEMRVQIERIDRVLQLLEAHR